MAVGMGLIRDRHGTWYARKAVPKKLREAVAQVLGAKGARSWLKRSTRTKDKATAKIIAKPILIEFDRILVAARARVATAPLRTSLSDAEVKMLCDYHYAHALTEDDTLRLAGHGVPDPDAPAGMSDLELSVFAVEDDVAEAVAQGDWELARPILDPTLQAFNIRLDPNGKTYQCLAMAMLRAHARAIDAIDRRNKGRPVVTPRPPSITASALALASGGSTLEQAFEGWRKARNPAPGTIAEYTRALRLFTQLHGPVAIADLHQGHAREFREALQDVPRSRPGTLAKATLPELAEWGRTHPAAKKIGAGNVNKLIGGVQAIAVWAFKNGYVPKETRWSDPFAHMRLDEDRSGREAFTVPELQAIFDDTIFVEGARPQAGRGEAAFWLPLLALFTGARQGELAALTVDSIAVDDETQRPLVSIQRDPERGRRTKTASSIRTLPLHHELLRLGFPKFVERTRRERGAEAWLFEAMSPDKPRGRPNWSKWFNRRLRDDFGFPESLVFHCFRGTFIDALRARETSEDLQQALVGHSNSGTMTRRYGANEDRNRRRYGVPTLIKAVDGVQFKGLDLSRVRAA